MNSQTILIFALVLFAFWLMFFRKTSSCLPCAAGALVA
jgi:hypothetical protein